MQSFLSTIFMFNSTVWYSISYFLSFAEFLKCILWLEIEQFENFIAVIMIFWIWCTFIHTYTILRCPTPLNRTRCLSKHMSPLMWIEIPWCLGVEGGGGPYLCDLSVWHSPVVSLPQCPGGWVWPPYSGEHWHTGCGPWLPPNEVEFC